jgi:hypothetical protein
MIIDANVLRGLADECVAAAAKCNDPDAAAKLLEIATKILELVRREMKPDIEQRFDGRRPHRPPAVARKLASYLAFSPQSLAIVRSP